MRHVDPARYARVKQIFLSAMELEEGLRSTFVKNACSGDVALRDEVFALLGQDPGAPLFAESTPAPAGAAAPLRPTDPLQLSGTLLDGRYAIERFVAEGGFGYVYKAEHVLWRRPLAIKVFKRVLGGDLEEELKAAFIKEGALLNELSRRTTGIVQSHDIGTWARPQGGLHLFTVLEWLEGRTLAAELAPGRRRPWTLPEVTHTLGPIAEALAVAHRSGVAHRDVKPSNIFLVEDTAKLLDFGVAKVAGEYAEGFLSTGNGVTAFTVEYAAPEQFERKWGTTGPWTDVHSLALLIVELLLGRHPIEGRGALQAYLHICDPATRPTPRALGLTVSAALEAVFERALALRAKDRTPDAGTFWRAFLAAAVA